MPRALLLIFLVLAASTSTTGANLDFANLNPVVEARAVWLNAGAIPKTEREIRQLVRAYRKANINLIFPEVVCRGYSVYPSRLIARDPRFQDALDPLRQLIDEAHKCGIEVHAWVWVFRVGYSGDPGGILTRFPDWAELGSDGNRLSPSGGLWISPANKAARDYIAAVFEELVKSYDLDGVHLDYVRYENESQVPFGYSTQSIELFRRQYAAEPPTSLNSQDDIHVYEWRKFRERMVNTFVQRIATEIRRIKPNVKISAAVVPDIDHARRNYMQNWLNWVDNKWLDFVVPMSYDSDDAHFARVVSKLRDAIGGKSIILAGIGSNTLREGSDQFLTQTVLSRQAGAHGQVFFAAAYLKEAHLRTLVAGPYRQPTELPFRHPERAASRILRQAAENASRGNMETADYLALRARDLISYVRYMSTPRGYVRPTPPP
ncbi:MAG: family 10 glycosylhydrolase [Armatimonadota bacterium]|nr:family 10 glycosylhydrolase [Armatimonadota bacterium]